MKKEEAHMSSVKRENMTDVKTIKTEGVKMEAGDGVSDCYIDKIDYSKKVPNFANVPPDVVKFEL